MMTQLQHFELARRRLAEADHTFMDIVTCPGNPMTREDLETNIQRRPHVWGRYAGWLDVLPTRDQVQETSS